MSTLRRIKEDIGVTWDEHDSSIQRTINRGIAFIDSTVGAELDYTEDGEAYSLLLNFVLYARSGIENEFKQNYLGDIIALQFAQSDENRKGINDET